MDLAERRENYESAGLDVADVCSDPVEQFERWYRDAEAAELWEPNSMLVSVVDSDGWPTSRYVLMKQFDAEGFVFYTNYQSAKGTALDAEERAAITFGWLPLRRQVRILGTVARVSPEESSDYFAQRPRGSQVGAWASPQSEVVDSRDDMDRRYAAIQAGVGDGVIERPDHWGGYRLRPVSFEFWQGRPNRFHDRLRYDLGGDATWSVCRLAP